VKESGTPSATPMSCTYRNMECELNQDVRKIQNTMLNNILLLWEHRIPLVPRK
jgi:hypothetical protein